MASILAVGAGQSPTHGRRNPNIAVRRYVNVGRDRAPNPSLCRSVGIGKGLTVYPVGAEDPIPNNWGESMSTVENVLDRHWEAFTTQDLAGIMADYAEGSFVITNFGSYYGRDEIEGLFSNLFDEFGQADVSMSLDQQVLHEEYAYIVWHAETPDNVYEFATDTFMIRDGAIVPQTFGGKVEPKE